MKKVSIYKPTSVDEAIQMLSAHGAEAGVYAGGTDLLIRLKNRLTQAPSYLVDIKKIQNLHYIKEDAQGNVLIGATTKLSELAELRSPEKALPDAGRSGQLHLIPRAPKRLHHRRRSLAGGLVPVSARRLLLLAQRRLHLLWRDRRQQLLPLRHGRPPVLRRLSRRRRHRADPVRRPRQTGHAFRDQRTLPRAISPRRHDGRRAHPVPCRSLQRNPHRSRHPRPEARPEGILRKAPSPRCLGLRHGLSGHKPAISSRTR